MQRKIAMGLCAFYLISVIGIAMNMHFCSGKLSSVRFIGSAKCPACKKTDKIENSHSCCKTTAIDVKVRDNHQAGSKINLPQNFSLELFLGSAFVKTLTRKLPDFFTGVENKAPPLSSILSLHLYNCVFRN